MKCANCGKSYGSRVHKMKCRGMSRAQSLAARPPSRQPKGRIVRRASAALQSAGAVAVSMASASFCDDMNAAAAAKRVELVGGVS